MTTKFDKFKAALIALCEEHGVSLRISEFDGDRYQRDIEVYDLYPGSLDDMDDIYCMIDRTVTE